MIIKTPQQIKSHVDSACFEIASTMIQDFNATGASSDDEITNKIKELKKNNVRDLQGALADILYNETDTIVDLVGDQVWDAAETKEDRLKLIQSLTFNDEVKTQLTELFNHDI